MTAVAPAAVSVVATVLNEADHVDRLLASLARQTRRPDEVVIADGGSCDGTLARLRDVAARGDIPLTVLSTPGANISAGRNAAIAAARGPLIACTDAGVRMDPDWLASITAPLARGQRFVAGFFVADPTGAFETALGAATLPIVDEIDPVAFLPSSRSVAFAKSAWEAAGRYPEWLDYCEDLVFDLRMREAVGRPSFAPDAIVRFRPRAGLAAFLRQYYLYARGDGKADLWLARHLVRYGVYLALAPAVVALAIVAHPAAWLLVFAGGAAMLRKPYRRLRRQWGALSHAERARAILWVPVIRVGGDVAKMAGYPVGTAWRLRNRPPDWRPAPGIARL